MIPQLTSFQIITLKGYRSSPSNYLNKLSRDKIKISKDVTNVNLSVTNCTSSQNKHTTVMWNNKYVSHRHFANAYSYKD